jgi:hypothetical protein
MVRILQEQFSQDVIGKSGSLYEHVLTKQMSQTAFSDNHHLVKHIQLRSIHSKQLPMKKCNKYFVVVSFLVSEAVALKIRCKNWLVTD